jgi:phosphate transport system protein
MSDVVGAEIAALQAGVAPHPVPGGGASDEMHQGDRRPFLHADIVVICDDVVAMGDLVETAIGRAVGAVALHDVAEAEAVISGDQAVNARQQRVREACYRLIVTQAPMACDLRAVMAAMQMSSELERMGDHCVSIAKEARALSAMPEAPVPAELVRLGELCAQQVRDVMLAVVRRDPDAARAVAGGDDGVDRVYHRLVDKLLGSLPEDADAAFRITNLVLVAHHLERIGDRVTNIAEDVTFAATGELLDLG